MRTALICHEGAALDQEGMTRWLGSFSEFTGTLVLREPPSRLWQRVRRELRRSGPLGLADVFAYRLWHRLRWASTDREREQALLEKVKAAYPSLTVPGARQVTSSPNTQEAKHFLESLQPDVVIARCKTLLKPEIFNIARRGTFAFHPGICPEYRNAHGCFWALAKGDYDNVGMTLLRIDEGVDTGPVYGQFRLQVKELQESTSIIQQRAVFDHLDPLREALESFYEERAQPLDVSGRPSAVWGQPRLTAYMRLSASLRRRHQS